MSVKNAILVSCFLVAAAFSYEIPDENEVITRTCRLSIKAEVIPDKTLEKPTGRAVVTVDLTDDESNPYRGERVEVRATGGTFICRLPEDSSSESSETDSDCFTTRDDGIAKLYLINIPLNTKVQIKASYDCGDRIINSTASLAISRARVKRKKQIRP